MRCQISRHSEAKGILCGDTERGGTWIWRLLPGAPMSPVPEAINVGSLGALNLCHDLRGLQISTAHFLVAPPTLGHAGVVPAVGTGKEGRLHGAMEGGAGRNAASLRPRCSTGKRAHGAARGAPTAFAKGANAARPPPTPALA